MIISPSELKAFLQAAVATPHDLLGMHPCEHGGRRGLVVRAFVQRAQSCEVFDVESTERRTYPMERLASEGFFEGFIPDQQEPFSYRLRIETVDREVRQFFDPYAFAPTISEHDLYLFNEGTEHYLHRKFGAHARLIDGVPGVAFVVWAPNARRVSVVGNFNQWDGRYHPMRALGTSGVWELFIPGLTAGELYKYEIAAADGSIRLKTDPFGTYFEPPPNNAAIVRTVDTGYTWHDAGWLEQRERDAGRLDRAISIYEVHFGSWRRLLEDNNRPLTYREMAPLLADHVIEMGFTHVELMPLAEYPFEGSWGYQVTGFFAPTHRYGTPDDFKYFIDYLHQRGLGVILDWVPAHFPRDSFALEHFDGTHLYEHADPRQGAHQDWGTLIFNYGRNEVRGFLVASAISWLDRYHIDGLRVDAVASMLYLDYSRKEGEWIPNRLGGRENLEAIEFLKQVNELVHRLYPGVLMIAEESTAWPGVTRPSPGGLGFDLKWNMGWMHDTLRYFSKDPIHRKWHHNDLTFGMLYQYAEKFVLVYSHDEVTHGKGSLLMKMGAGTIAEKARHLRSLYAFKWAWPGKKLLFMGSEFGQSAEWQHDRSLDWHLLEYMDHEGLRRLVRDLNRLYRNEPALHANDFNPENFRWINCSDADASVVSFLRHDHVTGDILVVVGHYTPVLRTGYRVGFPRGGFWQEMINTDSEFYGGSNHGNAGGVRVEEVSCDGLAYSATLTLPPVSTLVFKWAGD